MLLLQFHNCSTVGRLGDSTHFKPTSVVMIRDVEYFVLFLFSVSAVVQKKGESVSEALMELVPMVVLLTSVYLWCLWSQAALRDHVVAMVRYITLLAVPMCVCTAPYCVHCMRLIFVHLLCSAHSPPPPPHRVDNRIREYCHSCIVP